MRRLIKNIARLALFSSVLVSGIASAELFGMVNGRTADLSRAPQQSVELGASLAKFNSHDVQHLGLRINYKLNRSTVLYADVGQSMFDPGDEADGVTFGVGGFWQLPGLFDISNFAVHASFHRVDLDFSGLDNGLKGNAIVLEGLFSGKQPINQAGTLFFNASIGLHRSALRVTRLNADPDTDLDLMLSAGVVMETQSRSGEYYGSLFYVDHIGFGLGYRYYLN
ncbi:MAG: hypothetical protein AB8B64_19940 [Granulosicoccus sp.]